MKYVLTVAVGLMVVILMAFSVHYVKNCSGKLAANPVPPRCDKASHMKNRQRMYDVKMGELDMIINSTKRQIDEVRSKLAKMPARTYSIQKLGGLPTHESMQKTKISSGDDRTIAKTRDELTQYQQQLEESEFEQKLLDLYWPGENCTHRYRRYWGPYCERNHQDYMARARQNNERMAFLREEIRKRQESLNQLKSRSDHMNRPLQRDAMEITVITVENSISESEYKELLNRQLRLEAELEAKMRERNELAIKIAFIKGEMEQVEAQRK